MQLAVASCGTLARLSKQLEDQLFMWPFKKTPRLYGVSMEDLLEADIIEDADVNIGECGSFLVLREDMLHGLISDPVYLNRVTLVPKHCALPSPATLGSIKCTTGSQVYFKSGDVGV